MKNAVAKVPSTFLEVVPSLNHQLS